MYVFLDAVKSFIDKIFAVPIAFLDLCIEKLSGLSLVTAQGLNFSAYLGLVFGDLPYEWQLVISSLLIGLVLLITLLTVKAFMRMYYAAKEGVKWW